MSACGVCGDPAICRDHGCQQEAAEYAHMMMQQPEPEWTAEDECEGKGHAYYGDDPDTDPAMPGRCYCGTRRYHAGGANDQEQTVMTYGYSLEEARHLLTGWSLEFVRTLFVAGALRAPGWLAEDRARASSE